MSENIKPASKAQARYRATPKGKEYMRRDNSKRAVTKYLWSLKRRMYAKQARIFELQLLLVEERRKFRDMLSKVSDIEGTI